MRVAALSLLWMLSAAAAAEARVVTRCELSGTVDAGSASYVRGCVERATEQGHEAVLLRIDTPGGSLQATQDIVSALLGARVPVIVWVGPSGAQAGSAGAFLVLASHVAAMAPGTRVGAAHPVGVTGEDVGEGRSALAQKVENDAAAFARAIAEQRGRNADWAERAVRQSVSVPAGQALKENVIDLVADDEPALLAQLEGREVRVAGEVRALRTKDAQVTTLAPSLPQRILHALGNPSIAYLLLLLGGLGIAIELASPGAVLPGALGLACLILSFVVLASLPVRTGAALLVVLGIGLLIAELFVSSGLLGFASAGLIVLGGLLLVDPFDPDWFGSRSIAVPLRLVLPTALVTAAVGTFALVRLRQARRAPVRSGDVGMVGEHGRALTAVDEGGGQVFVHGERWRAVAREPVPAGAPVVVRAVRGLTLEIEKEST